VKTFTFQMLITSTARSRCAGFFLRQSLEVKTTSQLITSRTHALHNFYIHASEKTGFNWTLCICSTHVVVTLALPRTHAFSSGQLVRRSHVTAGPHDPTPLTDIDTPAAIVQASGQRER